jgi:hypothetical protein
MPANDDLQKAQRFREAALPYLDDVYTLSCATPPMPRTRCRSAICAL